MNKKQNKHESFRTIENTNEAQNESHSIEIISSSGNLPECRHIVRGK